MRITLATTPDHYRKLGLREDAIEPWEDGLRTDAGEGSFEWWYFDCHLDDGSKLGIEFHTKPPYVSPKAPLTPFVSLTLDRPNGTCVQKAFTGTADVFSASRDGCDVRIGSNTFAGNLRRYEIHVDVDGVVADVAMTTDGASWRPGTGHIFFGDDEGQYVAWFPAVPRGTVSVHLTVDGRSEELRGVGYHDHNWGNAALRKLVDHWYWGRARIKDYTVITLMFCSHETYGKRVFPTFMLAKGRELVASGGAANVRFTASEPSVIAESGVPVANRLVYEFDGWDSRYAVTFLRRKDIFALDFGKAGAYQRFLGDVILERRVDGQLVENEREDALWELLYFGPRSEPTR
jgi:hypothetical protein